MTVSEYVELLEKKFNPKNDSALADLLRVRPPTVYRYKNENGTFNDEVSVRVAKLLEINPLHVIADMDAARAISPTSKKYRKELAKVIMTLAIVWVPVCILCKIIKEINIRKYSVNYV